MAGKVLVLRARAIPIRGESMTQDRQLTVVAFAGSLRRGSYNRALLRAAQEVAPPQMAISIVEIDGVPLYNADVEQQGEPEPGARLKQAIREADGLLLATPEHKPGVTGITAYARDRTYV